MMSGGGETGVGTGWSQNIAYAPTSLDGEGGRAAKDRQTSATLPLMYLKRGEC